MWSEVESAADMREYEIKNMMILRELSRMGVLFTDVGSGEDSCLDIVGVSGLEAFSLPVRAVLHYGTLEIEGSGVIVPFCCKEIFRQCRTDILSMICGVVRERDKLVQYCVLD